MDRLSRDLQRRRLVVTKKPINSVAILGDDFSSNEDHVWCDVTK